ncbi:RHS repeat-associated core domain-containing protein [Acidomonas methanolica]|uniref:RHS repeat-associated core domain-containing protein n=1 Tax=Acidomonas methanolica TaxID=437 RepID=UPI002119F190|nr:RHS repeat-associated core domain-containing protein [Acidomonas methanolica]MCQ9154964.1 PAAR/RHS domain-containing protein [Acidomonas methanolica]
MSAMSAARVGDPFGHSEAMNGLLAGLAIGLAASVAVAAVVATGGAALPVIVGGIAAGTAGAGLMGESIGALLDGPPTGVLEIGSVNVLINGRPAVMALRGAGSCCEHDPMIPVATGSKTVLINGLPAARVGDKLVCSAVITEGSPNTMIGGPTAQGLAINPEVPAGVNYALMGVAFAGTAVTGGLAVAALGAAGGALGGYAGQAAASALGYGEKGQAIGALIGGTIGGLAGGFAGDRLSSRCWSGHPVDVASGEVMTEHEDFMLPGPIPLRFHRLWMSSSSHVGECGHGWHHSLDMALWPGASGRSWTYRNEEGRLIVFAPPAPGRPSLDAVEQLQLWTDGRAYWVTDFQGIRRDFGPPLAGDLRRFVRISDPNGNAITLSRSGGDRLTAIIDSAGRNLSVTTDEAGRVLSVIAPHPTIGHETIPLLQLEYDAAGDLIRSADALGNGFAYVYHGHLLVDETRPAGLGYHFRYDDVSLGRAARCVSTWGDGNLHERHFSYDLTRGVTRVVARDGACEEYFWDQARRITRIVDGLGRRSSRLYDALGRMTLETRADGATARLSFDAHGRVSGRQGFDGSSVSFHFSPLREDGLVTDRPRHIQAADGGISHYEWDERLNLIRSTDAAGRERRFLRDTRGRPLAVQDALGVHRRLGWTADGLPASEADGTGAIRVRYDWDRLGRLQRVAYGGVAATSYRRDLVGRVVEEKRQTGERAAYSYDAEGALIAFRDTLGQETRWRYDGLPVPLERRAADGGILRYAYDGDLNLIRLTNEKDEVCELTYDAAGQLVRERGFDGRRQTYCYDPAGFLLQHEDADGTRTRHRRDKAGRLVLLEPVGDAPTQYRYDAAGRLIEATNGWGALTFAYDPTGLLLSEQQGEHRLTHEHDARGRRIATVLPDGRRLETRWDGRDAAEEIFFAGRSVARFARDVLGREIERVAGGLTMRTDYDPQGRLARQRAEKSHRPPLIDRSYRYDGADQLRELSDLALGNMAYGYDSCGRLISVEGWAEERFNFDPAGNILQGVAAAPGNRLEFHGDRHFTYDARGNRIGERRGARGGVERDYRYGADNQLREMEERTRLGTLRARYRYDPLGRRVSKEIERWTLPAANDAGAEGRLARLSAERHVFVWLGDVLLGEGPEGSPFHTVYLHEPESFRPLAMIRGGAVCHYHLDHLGTPREVTNDRGEVIWRGWMKAWGAVARASDAAIAQPLRFQGQYEDTETGLYYNRFRYYAPETGCYIQQDPIGLLARFNLYSYPHNPLAESDPLGLMPWRWNPDGMGHHLVWRNKANTAGLNLENLGTARDTPTYFPEPYRPGDHELLHRVQAPYLGSRQGPWEGTSDELLQASGKGLSDAEVSNMRGSLKIPRTGEMLAQDVSPKDAYVKLMEWHNKSRGLCE